MPSPSYNKYISTRENAKLFRKLAANNSDLTLVEKQNLYHAALAVNVASFDSYINNIIKDFFTTISDPLRPDYNLLHQNLEKITLNSLSKFNTPNFENTRNILIVHTGYDPISDWIWPARRMQRLQVQEKLNQILKIRHSFAHGFQMPAFTWNQTISGKIRLTSSIIKDCELFFDNIVKRTDQGLKQYISTNFQKTMFWE